MAANEIIIPGAEEINYYFRNMSYANLLSDMPILSWGLANDTQQIVWKNGAGLARIVGDVNGPLISTAGNLAGFSNTDGKTIKDLGFGLIKNVDFDLVEYTASNGSKIKIGYDDVIPFKNDTGGILPAGTYMHLVNVTTVGSEILPTFEKTNASVWEKVQGTIGATTNIVPVNGVGHIDVKGQIGGVDTTHITGPTQIWLSATVEGGFTDVEPSFPDYSISVGGGIDSQIDGNILVNITGDYKETFHDAWDGAIRESFNFIVGSLAGTGVVLGVLTNVNPARNLTCLFSGGFFTLDTTTNSLAIQLTPGTDEIVVTNYVFVPKSTNVLTVNTTGFPETEHCKIAIVDCQSATGSTSSIDVVGGPRGNQNINDHIKKESNNGHILHIAEWIRDQPSRASKKGGCEVTLSGEATDDGWLTMSSGVIKQMHPQSIPSLTMPTVSIMVANDPDTPWAEIDNLNEITKYSDGTPFDKWSKIVVWVIANKSGQPDFLVLNLPREGENDPAKALLDEKQRADYSISEEYVGKSALLGAFVIKIAGGNLDYQGAVTGYQDLRGTVPSNIAGGGTGGGVSSYLALSDTPNTFFGQAGKVPEVNATETALEFTAKPDLLANATEILVSDGTNAVGFPDFVRDASGNVGIGTDSPSSKIDFVSAPEVSIPALGVPSTVANIGASLYGTMMGSLNSGDGYIQQQRTDGTATAYDLLLQPNGGNVGIGTSSPDALLDVNGVALSQATISQIAAEPTGKVLVTREYLGELRITIPVGGTVNVTSETIGSNNNAFTLMSGFLDNQAWYSISFGTSKQYTDRSLTSNSPIGLATLTKGWQITNQNPTDELEITIKAIGKTLISQLIVS